MIGFMTWTFCKDGINIANIFILIIAILVAVAFIYSMIKDTQIHRLANKSKDGNIHEV